MIEGKEWGTVTPVLGVLDGPLMLTLSQTNAYLPVKRNRSLGRKPHA